MLWFKGKSTKAGLRLINVTRPRFSIRTHNEMRALSTLKKRNLNDLVRPKILFYSDRNQRGEYVLFQSRQAVFRMGHSPLYNKISVYISIGN
jgi:hypothetical protein